MEKDSKIAYNLLTQNIGLCFTKGPIIDGHSSQNFTTTIFYHQNEDFDLFVP